MILNISYLTRNKVDAHAFNKRIKVMINRMGRQLSNYHRFFFVIRVILTDD